MSKSLSELREDLRYANEGLAQMQAPDAGYFEDPENPEQFEMVKYNQDVDSICHQIDRIEKQIMREEARVSREQ